MSESLKSSSSCAPIPESEGDTRDCTGSKSSPADGVGFWAEAEAAARTSNGRNERIFQGSSGQYRVQYTMTENLPINNDGKVPARSKVAHPIRVTGLHQFPWRPFAHSPARSFEQAPPPVAGGGRVFYGVARHHHPEHSGAGHFRGPARDSAEHEVGVGQLYLEPGGFHSHQRLDGGPVRHPPGICLGDRPVHPGIISLRHLHQHSPAGRLPHPAGLRRSHDGAGRPADPGAHVCQIRAHPGHELCGYSRPGRSHAGTRCRWAHRRILSLAADLLS